MTTARKLVLAIVLLALALRVVPVEHGLPRRYVPDHHMIKRALVMASERSIAPPIAADMSYPYLVPYLLLPTYAAEYVAGKAAGKWNNPQDFQRAVTLEPAWLHVPARLWMALCGALTAWAVYRAARAGGLERGALAAAWLSATCLLNVQLSTHERPWAATILFGALSAWAAVVHARDGSRKSLLASGAAVGLSFACHQSGLAFVVLPAFAWAFAPRAWNGAELRSRLLQGLGCVATFALVAFVSGHLYYLHGRPGGEQVIGGGTHDNAVAIGGQSIRTDFEFDSIPRLVTALFGYDPALVLLGILGVFVVWKQRPLRACVVACAVVAAAALVNPSDHVRYLLPACMLLTLPAGALVERLWLQRNLRPLVVVLLALPLVQAVRFDLVLRRLDTRAECEIALATLPAGSVVAIDHYGPQVDLSEPALARLATLRTLYAREELRRAYFEAKVPPPTGPGVDAIQCEDLFGIDPATLEYSVSANETVRALGATPKDVLAKLGVTHLLLVERRPGHEARPLAPLVAGREPLSVVDPSAEVDDPCSEAFLPTEMDFPLMGLWQVTRPGPRLELYELQR